MESKDSGILKEGTLGNDILKLCASKESVSSLVAADPTLAGGDAWQTLYGKYRHTKDGHDTAATTHVDDIVRAAQCGKWGPTKPSDLFLKVNYLDHRQTVFIMEILRALFANYPCRSTVMSWRLSRRAPTGPWSARHCWAAAAWRR